MDFVDYVVGLNNDELLDLKGELLLDAIAAVEFGHKDDHSVIQTYITDINDILAERQTA